MLLHILAHIDTGKGMLIIKQEVGQCLGKLGLSNTCRPQEYECSKRFSLFRKACLVTPDSIGYSLDSLLLPYHTLAEDRLKVDVFLYLGGHHLGHRNTSPGRYNPGNILLANLLLEHAALPLDLLELLCLCLPLCLDLRDKAILYLAGLGQVAFPFVLGLLALKALKLLLEPPDLVDGALLVLPLELHGILLVLKLGQFLLYVCKPFLGGIICLPGKGMLLDIELQDLTLYLIQFGRLALDLHLKLAGSLVHKVDSLVRQESGCDVTVRKYC